jgi:hypothetical protein
LPFTPVTDALFVAVSIVASPHSLPGFVVTNSVILKLSDVDRGDGAAADGLSFNTRISIDLIR